MKRLITFTVCCFIVMQLSAQTTIRELWKTMPDSILPYFNAAARSEIIDTYKTGKVTKTKNLLEGESWAKNIKDNYICIQLNNTTEMQLQLLHSSDSTSTICMVKTFGVPAAESEITFFDMEWKRIDSDFGLPDFNDKDTAIKLLLQKPDTISDERFGKMKKMFEPATTVAQLDADGKETITFSINGLLLTRDEEKELKPIKMQKTFKWSGKAFK